jgi:hypothetical protein
MEGNPTTSEGNPKASFVPQILSGLAIEIEAASRGHDALAQFGRVLPREFVAAEEAWLRGGAARTAAGLMRAICFPRRHFGHIGAETEFPQPQRKARADFGTKCAASGTFAAMGGVRYLPAPRRRITV